MRRLLLLVLPAAFLCATAPALAAPHTTVERTIQDCDGDNILDMAPGEPHIRPEAESPPPDDTSGGGGGDACRPDETGRRPERFDRRASLLHFLQLTDFQMVDEESPGRVEFLDGSQRFPGLNPFSAAYRPQESLTTQITEASVRNARNTVSPVTGAPLDFTLLTGDNADSQQHNETRWFIDILDGTTGPGNPDPEMDRTPEDGDRKVDPNSGVPGLAPVAGQPPFPPAPGAPQPTCDATPGTIYDGVRAQGNTTPAPDNGYYEPDSSSGGQNSEDGDGYSPVRSDNQKETGREVEVRDFPGLFERANEPFEAVGLGMPWYSAFGNHDALIQGNSPDAYIGPGLPNPLTGTANEFYRQDFNAIATGCIKVTAPTTAQATLIATFQAIVDNPASTPEAVAEANDDIQRVANQALTDAARNPAAFAAQGGTFMIVPRDDRRCYLAKDDPNVAMPDTPCEETGSWIAQHFRTTGTPVGHGFAPTAAEACPDGPQVAACRSAAAANQTSPTPGLGRPPSAIANHDGYYSFSPKPGFRFLAMDTVTDECGAPVCAEGSIDDEQFRWLESQLALADSRGEQAIAFGHHTLRTMRQPSLDASEQPIHYGQRGDRENPANPENVSVGRSIEELFCEHRSLIAYVAGHEHENYVRHYRCEQDPPPAPGVFSFHQISTAAHIDFPQQARAIEIVRQPDGKLAFVLTLIDHDGPADPGGPRDGFEQGTAPHEPVRLAGIGREIAFNDYQHSRGARGGREDRNVILPIERP